MTEPAPSDSRPQLLSPDEDPQAGDGLFVRKRWLFRLCGIIFGLGLVVLLEVSCRLVGWGNPVAFDDPFVGFSEVYPLFQEQDDRYEVVPSRKKFFAHESFPVEKPADGFRVFCLGQLREPRAELSKRRAILTSVSR